jgi:hypothetical protein
LKGGGVLGHFKDVEFLKQFKINEEIGTLTWGTEIDIGSETLYAEATGAPLPHWMETKRKRPANKALNGTPYSAR